MLKTIRKLSIVVGILALLTVILLNFMPVLNIKLTGVESDYTFGAAGGQNFVGRQCIFYWWGPSIYIGGVSAFNFSAHFTSNVTVDTIYFLLKPDPSPVSDILSVLCASAV